MSLSSLAKTEIKLPSRRSRTRAEQPSPARTRRQGSRDAGIVGLDIEPGEVVAAQAHVRDGAIAVERLASGSIDHELVRDGEVADPHALGAWLRDFFAEHDLPKVVRVGATSHRAVMRTIDLPPLTAAGDIANAVRIQAPEHIAMAADRMVLDHRVVGRVDTPGGPRTRVVVAAAERDSIASLLEAVRRAGLKAAGVDLPSFALVRAMYDPARPADQPLLCANIAGVTTLAIARGAVCEMTRVSPIDLEQLSRRLAEREAISVTAARARLLGFRPGPDQDEVALGVLDAGLADLADDLVNTIEFHAQSAGAPAVSEVAISGPAAAIPNFAEVLGERMGMPVRRAELREPSGGGGVSAEHSMLAAGLAVEEVAA